MNLKDPIQKTVRRYLSISQKRKEAGFSIFAAAWSSLCLVGYSLDYVPLAWTNFGPEWNQTFLKCVLALSIVHACGTLLNGHWRWSPLIRLFGSVGMAAAFILMTYMTPWQRFSSGTLPYGLAAYYFSKTAWGIWPDVVDAWWNGASETYG